MNVVLVGKSGGGKDRILKELKERFFYIPIISYTTRPMREGEEQGREYNFVSKKYFEDMIANESFIEYRTYNTLVNGVPDVWYYGVLKNTNYCLGKLDELYNYYNRVIILDLQGAKDFIKYAGKDNTKVIYIECDDEIRKERAKSRGSFDETEWNRRLADDNEKFSEENLAKIIDARVLNNGDLEETVRNVFDAINEITDIRKYIKERKIDKIFLDIDGVILHSCDAMAKLLSDMYNKKVTGDEILSWNFKEISNEITEPELEYLFTTEKFFDIVKPIEGAIDFIKSCPENSIVFVTKGRWQNFIGKEKLFEKLGLGDIPMVGLPMNVGKEIINMSYDIDNKRSLFIDDNTKNLECSNAMYKIQFREYRDDKEREWQEGWTGKVMYHW